jgi:hypothetical protein
MELLGRTEGYLFDSRLKMYQKHRDTSQRKRSFGAGIPARRDAIGNQLAIL